MAFADLIRDIPGHARTAQAKGFLPPFMRGMSHLLYVLADSARETPSLTVDEVLTELNDAAGHWDEIAGTDVLSTAANNHLTKVRDALGLAIGEFPEWDAAARTRHMRDLLNKTVGFAVPLDRELLGLADSDAGTAL